MAINEFLLNLCQDRLNNSITVYSENPEKADEAIRKAFIQLLGNDPKKLRKNMRTHSTEIYALMEEILDTSLPEAWKDNPFFDQFVETRNLLLGDEREFIVDDDSLFYVAEYSGNHWDTRRQSIIGRQSFTTPTVWLVVKAYSDFERFVKGLITFPEMISKIQMSFTNELNNRVYDSFMKAGDSLPSEFTESGTYDSDTLNELISKVQAATGTATPPVIAGVRTALSPLLKDAEFYSNEMKQERNQTGKLAMWDGIPLLEIPNSFVRNTYTFKYDPNKLMILPNAFRPIKVTFEGDTRAKSATENTDNMDMTLEYQFASKVGIGVVFNKLYGIYNITK